MRLLEMNSVLRRMRFCIYFSVSFFVLTTCGSGQTTSGLLGWERIEVPESAEKAIELESGEILLRGVWGGVELTEGATGAMTWEHAGREMHEKTLSPYAGEVIEDRYTTAGLEAVRQVWVSKGKDCVGIRMRVYNRGEKPIRLETMIPWRSEGDASIRLGKDVDSSNWELVVQAWRKNGDPRAVVPAGAYTRDVDQFMLLRGRGSEDRPTLRMGYLEQMGHLAQLRTEFVELEGKAKLKEITARCVFDGCVVPPGGARTSNWLLFTIHEDAGESMHEYAERVAGYYGLPEPGPAPTVWCSWYYYSSAIEEKDITENLEVLAKNPQPYDVIQIDDGWNIRRGDWYANAKFPSGMKATADRIRAQGYQAGIWTSPYLVIETTETAKKHPEWLLKHADGTFHRGNGNACVLDPTYPGVCEHLEETYRRLTFDYGYTYHKLDFMRAVIMKCKGCGEKEGIHFYDPTVTRLEAYRRGLEAIRRGAGPNAYIAVCGGNYGASLGLAQGQRNGGDVRSYWDAEGETAELANEAVMRSWMRRLWHTDADSMTVRRRTEALSRFGGSKGHLGLFTDEEAQSISLKQYLTGGICILTENLNDIEADRLELYKHVIPSINAPGIVLDPFQTVCARKVLTRVQPTCADLSPWVTVTVMNWEEKDFPTEVKLSDIVLKSIPAEKYLVTEFFSQKALGLFRAGETIDLGTLAAHSSRVLRIAPWDGETVVLAGTDLHYSGGGAEIVEWFANADEAAGRLETDWRYPVKITVAFPDADSFVLRSMTVAPGQKKIRICRD